MIDGSRGRKPLTHSFARPSRCEDSTRAEISRYPGRWHGWSGRSTGRCEGERRSASPRMSGGDGASAGVPMRSLGRFFEEWAEAPARCWCATARRLTSTIFHGDRMADKKISQLPLVTSAADDDVLVLVVNGTTSAIRKADLLK